MIPRPMSLGRPGLFVLIKDYAFLRASAHESVPLAGYLLNTCWILVGYLRFPVERRAQKTIHQTLAGSSEMVLGRARATLGSTWGHLGANLNQNLSTWGRNVRFWRRNVTIWGPGS